VKRGGGGGKDSLKASDRGGGEGGRNSRAGTSILFPWEKKAEFPGVKCPHPGRYQEEGLLYGFSIEIKKKKRERDTVACVFPRGRNKKKEKSKERGEV